MMNLLKQSYVIGLFVSAILLSGCPAEDPVRVANQADKNIAKMNVISEELMKEFNIKLYTQDPMEVQTVTIAPKISLFDLETVIRPKIQKYIGYGQKVILASKKKKVRVLHSDKVMTAVGRAHKFLKVIDERIQKLKAL